MWETLLVVSCVLVVAILFFQRTILLRISMQTTHCADILGVHRHKTDLRREYGLPTKLVHGQIMPEFEVANLQTGDSVNRQSVLGSTSVIVFCTKSEYEQWELGFLFAFFQNCWNRIDGHMFVVFVDQTTMDLSNLPHPEVLQSYLGKSIVLCVDVKVQIKQVMGLSQTPCIVELDAQSVVSKVGFVDHRD